MMKGTTINTTESFLERHYNVIDSDLFPDADICILRGVRHIPERADHCIDCYSQEVIQDARRNR